MKSAAEADVKADSGAALLNGSLLQPDQNSYSDGGQDTEVEGVPDVPTVGTAPAHESALRADPMRSDPNSQPGRGQNVEAEPEVRKDGAPPADGSILRTDPMPSDLNSQPDDGEDAEAAADPDAPTDGKIDLPRDTEQRVEAAATLDTVTGDDVARAPRDARRGEDLLQSGEAGSWQIEISIPSPLAAAAAAVPAEPSHALVSAPAGGAAAPEVAGSMGENDGLGSFTQEQAPAPDAPLELSVPSASGPETVLETDSTSDGKQTEISTPEKQRRRPAAYRDRRGARRARQQNQEDASVSEPASKAHLTRSVAEVRLRLMLHPIRRTAILSLVPSRPFGYPEHVTLENSDGETVAAYSDSRYDDIDAEWTGSLLAGEIGLQSKEGYRWIRGTRRIHIFREIPDEAGLLSAGSAVLARSSTIICRDEDAAGVRSAAKLCGSPALTAHAGWTGIPSGWTVLSGYTPAHQTSAPLEQDLTALDPGSGAEISFSGGLQIRARVFADGFPPRIEILPVPTGASVTIGGASAHLEIDGAWTAPEWDRPGEHLVDVVPGPSATYQIASDPWLGAGWERWNAHPGLFTSQAATASSVAGICGAMMFGPRGEHVVAAAAAAAAVLGLQRGAAVLWPRPDVPASVGLLAEAPAFLISAISRRRAKG
ncbi:MAG TPA: hypothetical protein VGU23_01860, partial [Acidobacteriaceae bacterium]|nr:hypothetical protein [Acidobacteriaceae bacterium]